MNRIMHRAWIVVLLALALAGGFVFFVYEYATQSENWVYFSGSMHVYDEGKLSEGMVTDREGYLLLDISQGRTYTEDADARKALLHWLGDRQGNVSTPIYARYTKEMVGYDPISGMYSYGDAAGELQLTLSARVQKAALTAMGKYAGTVAVYNYETGELLCAVSTPTFDPDRVPDIAGDTTGAYDGVYMNRFLQSAYTPGSIFKIVTLAAALENSPELLEREFTCTGSYAMGSGDVTCGRAHGKQDLKKAFANSCNCAFAQITQLLGKQTMESFVSKLELTKPVSFDGITTASGNFELSQAYGEELGWSGIGQYTDLVNPCRFLTLLGVIAGGGNGAQPHVVARVSAGTRVTYEAQTVKTGQLISSETARLLREYLQNNVETVYGSENFPSLTVCAKSGTGEVGGGKKPNAMFAGFAADEKYPLAFIVCVQDGGYGSSVCVPIIAPVLEACKAVLDGK